MPQCRPTAAPILHGGDDGLRNPDDEIVRTPMRNWEITDTPWTLELKATSPAPPAQLIQSILKKSFSGIRRLCLEGAHPL
jgi:hypothetical protein